MEPLTCLPMLPLSLKFSSEVLFATPWLNFNFPLPLIIPGIFSTTPAVIVIKHNLFEQLTYLIFWAMLLPSPEHYVQEFLMLHQRLTLNFSLLIIEGI